MRIGLVAGETSGDLLGAGLIKALRRLHPETEFEFEGVAGPEMQAAGCTVLEPAEALAVMGLIEPLREIPRLLRLRRSLVSRWTENPPDVFVGIDAPDFNLGLEKKLRAEGIKTVHYVSPSVWAWRQGRVKTIAKAADIVLCLLPFEKVFYDQQKVTAEFVGHPMADRTPANPDTAQARTELGINTADASGVLAVLPGSRHSEVSKVGPIFAETCARLAAEDSRLVFVAPMATPRLRALFQAQLVAVGIADRFILIDRQAELVITSADVVLLVFGTASLQTALLQKPMIGAHRVAFLTYAIAKGLNLVKVPYYSLPNLLTDEPLVPEFLQHEAQPGALEAAVRRLLDDADERKRIADSFAVIRRELARGADERAAGAVMSLALQH
jgi:lipid-A-disaccharide synthase